MAAPTVLGRSALAKLISQAAAGHSVPSRLAVAVSGSPESMALAALLKESHGPLALALTVDDGRSAAKSEIARDIANEMARLGISHQTLRPDLAIDENDFLLPTQCTTAAADTYRRTVILRQRLLLRMCAERQIPWLLLAHCQDDQIETVLYRYSRFANLENMNGLSPTPPVLNGFPLFASSQNQPVKLLRPLLQVSRETLRATCTERGVNFHEPETMSFEAAPRKLTREVLSMITGSNSPMPHFTKDAILNFSSSTAFFSTLSDQVLSSLLKKHALYIPTVGGFRLQLGDFKKDPTHWMHNKVMATKVIAHIVSTVSGSLPVIDIRAFEDLYKKIYNYNCDAGTEAKEKDFGYDETRKNSNFDITKMQCLAVLRNTLIYPPAATQSAYAKKFDDANGASAATANAGASVGGKAGYKKIAEINLSTSWLFVRAPPRRTSAFCEIQRLKKSKAIEFDNRFVLHVRDGIVKDDAQREALAMDYYYRALYRRMPHLKDVVLGETHELAVRFYTPTDEAVVGLALKIQCLHPALRHFRQQYMRFKNSLPIKSRFGIPAVVLVPLVKTHKINNLNGSDAQNKLEMNDDPDEAGIAENEEDTIERIKEAKVVALPSLGINFLPELFSIEFGTLVSSLGKRLSVGSKKLGTLKENVASEHQLQN